LRFVLNGNVRDLRLGCLFRIDVVLSPLGRYPSHPHTPCQRDPLQQQLLAARFGFRRNWLPDWIFHALSPTVFPCEFGLPRVNMAVLDHMIRSASWTDWHPLFLTSRLPAILHYYPVRTTRKTGRSPPFSSMRPPCLYSRRSSSSGVGRWKNTIHGFIIASGIEKLVGEGCEFLIASRCINSSADTSRKCTSLLAPSCFARDR
jgi:hypothetical protein